MECVIGIQFKNFVLLASDKTSVWSIIVVKNDMNKIFKLSDRLLLGVTGEPGDSVQFSEYISKNIQLYKMRNGYEMSPTAASNYIQRNLASYLRSRTPYMVNLLVAGFDTQKNEAELHVMDYLATCTKVPYGMHGYGGFFVMGLMDRIYKSDCTLEEGVDMMKKCVAEIQKRMVINLPAFKLCVIDKDGARDLDDIVVDTTKLGLSKIKPESAPASPMVH